MSYEEELEWFRARISTYLNSKYRRDKEYGDYLARWFSEEICDGFPFSLKVKFKRLPMSYNVYFS